jgi:cell division protein FtsL
MSKDDVYTNVLLEQIRDQSKAVLEAVGQIQDKVKTLATQESLDRLETKADTIQAAVTATNQDIRDLDRRTTIIEQAA